MQPLSPLRQLLHQRDSRDRFGALQELALQLSAMTDQQEIAATAADWLAALGFGVLIIRREEQGQYPLALAGFPDHAPTTLHAIATALSDQDLDHARLVQGSAVLVEEVLHDNQLDELNALLNGSGYQAMLRLPLEVGDHKQGTAVFFAPTLDELNPETIRLLELLSRQVTVALRYAQIADDLQAREIQTEHRNEHLRLAYDLVASERRTLMAVLDSASEAVLVTDADGVVQLGNPAVETALGLHPDMLLGRPLEQTDVPEQLVQLLYEAQESHATREGEIALPEGRVFHVSIAPVQTFDEPLQGYVALLKDITHFKQLDEMKSRFVSTVSHDLKSPLHVIGGYVRLLERAGPLNTDQTEFVAQIMTSVRHLTSLVTDLLDLGRLEAKVGLEIEPCDIVAIISAAVKRYRVIADEKNITFQVQTELYLPLVHGDERRLQQVISNLLSNALTYTPPSGVVELRGEVVNDWVRVSVRDSGIGIAPRDIAHIFEPFYRAENAKEMHSGGTGLGLAIVKRIIDEHGGDLGVESTPHNGSTFWFSVPIAPTGS